MRIASVLAGLGLLAACGGLLSGPASHPPCGDCLGEELSPPEDSGLPSHGDAGHEFPDGGELESDGDQDASVLDAGFSGDGGPFTFEELSAPTGLRYRAVHGTSASDVLIGTTTGEVLHFDGQQLTTIFRSIENEPVRGVYAAPSGAIHVLAGPRVFSCTSNCRSQSAFYSSFSVPLEFVAGLCGRGEQVYAVGQDNLELDGLLLEYKGFWDTVTLPDGTRPFNACWVGGEGQVLIAGIEDVFRYDTDGGVAIETVDYSSFGSSGDSHEWRAIHGVGDAVFIAGGNKTLAHRTANATWAFDLNFLSGAGDFLALAGVYREELFAGGAFTPGVSRARFDGSAWSRLQDTPNNFDIYGMWAATPNDYFVVGQTTSGNPVGKVLRGRR